VILTTVTDAIGFFAFLRARDPVPDLMSARGAPPYTA